MATLTQNKSWFSDLISSLNIVKPNIFVETGSYVGNGINEVKDDFQIVHSIELDQKWYLLCKELFINQPDIHLHLGDSSEILETLFPELNEPVIFYLDAHYSGGETAFGNEEEKGTPLLRELEILGKRNHKDIIVINDMRLMGKKSYGGIKDDIIYPLIEYDWVHITIEKMLEKYNRVCKIYFPNDIDRLILLPNDDTNQ
jgi:hypothetical protein